jgi:hypothetical protein
MLTYNSPAYIRTLTSVLQPRPAPEALRCVQPAELTPGSAADVIADRAAEQIRTIYLNSQRYVKFDERDPAPFFDAMADTCQCAHQVEQSVADELVAALTLTIFNRAGWIGGGTLRPTTLAGQVRMQVAADEAALQARQFMAKQAALI